MSHDHKHDKHSACTHSHEHESNDNHTHCDHDHDCDHDHTPSNDNAQKPGRLASLFNNKVTQAIGKYKKPLVIAGSFALAASSALVAPALALPSAAGLGIGLYLMHQSSEYALDDIGKFGKAAGMSAITLGVLSGLVHSASEAIVSAQAVAGGNTDLALSNIVGGSIVHTLGILGAAAAIAGIGDKKGGTLGWKFNTFVMAGGAGAFATQLASGSLWPGLSAGMLGYGAYYLYKRTQGGEDCVHDHEHGASCGHDHGHDHHTHDDTQSFKDKALDGTKAALSLGALIGISHYVVKSALDLSDSTNLNHTFMGVVIVAAGTALSEAYLTIRAAMKKDTSFALGNVLGCNITNTLLVGGAIGAISGLDTMGVELAEYLKNIEVPDQLNLNTLEGKINWGTFVGAAAGVTGLMAAQKGHISRKQGGVMLAAYLSYVTATYHFSEPLFNCHEDFVDGAVVEHCIKSDEDLPALEKDNALPVINFE